MKTLNMASTHAKIKNNQYVSPKKNRMVAICGLIDGIFCSWMKRQNLTPLAHRWSLLFRSAVNITCCE